MGCGHMFRARDLPYLTSFQLWKHFVPIHMGHSVYHVVHDNILTFAFDWITIVFDCYRYLTWALCSILEPTCVTSGMPWTSLWSLAPVSHSTSSEYSSLVFLLTDLLVVIILLLAFVYCTYEHFWFHKRPFKNSGNNLIIERFFFHCLLTFLCCLI